MNQFMGSHSPWKGSPPLSVEAPEEYHGGAVTLALGVLSDESGVAFGVALGVAGVDSIGVGDGVVSGLLSRGLLPPQPI